MGDSAETRERLLLAGFREFASKGLAGARVDRVAGAAGISKQGIYNYFGGKEGLFLAVMERHVTTPVAALPFAPGELPAFAGRLFDLLDADPDIARLIAWSALESRHGPGMALDAFGVAADVRRIRDGQVPPEGAGGVYAGHLAALLRLCVAWCGSPVRSSASVESGDGSWRRAAVVESARALAAASAAVVTSGSGRQGAPRSPVPRDGPVQPAPGAARAAHPLPA
ncbi:TetR/AcrR family transcriptional regulator [Clavibacter michiganensis]|uniref:TetR/AcrR family transcriptional regulator n=1 Tax=Clavibacter michiganensis TaxID=28447 RepID=UPI003EB84CA1